MSKTILNTFKRNFYLESFLLSYVFVETDIERKLKDCQQQQEQEQQQQQQKQQILSFLAFFPFKSLSFECINNQDNDNDNNNNNNNNNNNTFLLSFVPQNFSSRFFLIN